MSTSKSRRVTKPAAPEKFTDAALRAILRLPALSGTEVLAMQRSKVAARRAIEDRKFASERRWAHFGA